MRAAPTLGNGRNLVAGRVLVAQSYHFWLAPRQEASAQAAARSQWTRARVTSGGDTFVQVARFVVGQSALAGQPPAGPKSTWGRVIEYRPPARSGGRNWISPTSTINHARRPAAERRAQSAPSRRRRRRWPVDGGGAWAPIWRAPLAREIESGRQFARLARRAVELLAQLVD